MPWQPSITRPRSIGRGRPTAWLAPVVVPADCVDVHRRRALRHGHRARHGAHRSAVRRAGLSRRELPGRRARPHRLVPGRRPTSTRCSPPPASSTSWRTRRVAIRSNTSSICSARAPSSTSRRDGVKNYWNYGVPAEKYPFDTRRLRKVLEVAAEKAGWSKRSRAKGRGMGIVARAELHQLHRVGGRSRGRPARAASASRASRR